MKELVVGTIVGMSLAGSAMAADLARPAPVYVPAAPVVVPVFGWTGLYVGANVGGHWGKDDVSTIASLANFTTIGAATFDALSPASLNPRGIIGGLQGGFNWQIGSIVLGLEGDISWLGGAQSQSGATQSRTLLLVGPGVAAGDSFSNSIQPTFLATVRPRLGIAVDHALPYVTGGAAFGTLKTTDSASVFSGTVIESASNTARRTGWTVGGGLDYSFAGAWSARVEYLYVNLGQFDTAIPCLALCIDATDVVVHHKYSDNIVRAGVNYRFGVP